MRTRSALATGLLAVVNIGLVSCGGAAQPAAPVNSPSVPSPSVGPSSSTAGGSAPGSAQSSAVAGGTLSWNFDQDVPGGLPKGAQVYSGTWTVRAEADTPSPPNALCQTGNAEYPAISLGDATYTNLTMSTRFKPISGKTDQAAGLILRIQDKDNYYIVRANALENNVIFFKYVGGRRSTIKEGSTKVLSGQWQELRAEVSGDRVRAFLNGQLVVEASDGTFKSAGRVGLWTKADSVTCFDDVTVTPAG
ncbi:MAG TPA: family 16 glycoside hydrolase [Chloroflexota bacterium]